MLSNPSTTQNGSSGSTSHTPQQQQQQQQGEHQGNTTSSVSSTVSQPPIPDWNKLSFEFTQTKSHIQYRFKNGKWDQGHLVSDPYISLHIAGINILLFL